MQSDVKSKVENRWKVTTAILVVALAVSLFVVLYQAEIQPQVGVAAQPSFIDVTISGARTKLGVNDPETFTATVNSDHSGGMEYTWSITPNDNKTTLTPLADKCTLEFVEATEEAYSLSCTVKDLVYGNQGSGSIAVYDPYTSPNLYLGAYGAPYSYLIETDGLGWYRAINGQTGAVSWSSTNYATVVNQAFNNTATGGKVVSLGSATLTDTLLIHSGQTFENKGTITLAAQSNCTMLSNYNFGITTNDTKDTMLEDQNIEVYGGVWDGNGDYQTRDITDSGLYAQYVHGFFFYNIYNLKIHDLTMIEPNNWGIRLQNGAHWSIYNIQFNSTKGEFGTGINRDGVHVYGPASDFFIDNIYGQSQDDLVAICNSDYAWGRFGDSTLSGEVKYGTVSNCRIQNNGTGSRIVIIYNMAPMGSGATIHDIAVSNIAGNTTANAVCIFDDSTTLRWEPFYRITINNVNAVLTPDSYGSNYAAMTLFGTDITVSNVNLKIADGKKLDGLRIGNNTNLHLQNVNILNIKTDSQALKLVAGNLNTAQLSNVKLSYANGTVYTYDQPALNVNTNPYNYCLLDAPLTEGQGTAVFDYSTTAATGTLKNITEQAWITGNLYGGNCFNATGTSYISFPESTALKNMDAMTIVIVFKLNTLDSWNRLFSKNDGFTGNDQFQLSVTNTNKLQFGFGGNVTGNSWVNGGTSLVAGRWYMGVGVWDPITQMQYVYVNPYNGVADGSYDWTATPQQVIPQNMGDIRTINIGYSQKVNEYALASFNYAQIYNYAMPPAQIQQLYERLMHP